MDFSNNLSDIRKENGLSQEALSEKVGVRSQTIYRYEAGAN